MRIWEGLFADHTSGVVSKEEHTKWPLPLCRSRERMKKRGELLTIRHRESSREVHATIQDEASFEIDQADEFCKYQWATLCELPGQTHHPLWLLSSGSPLGELQNIDHLSPHDLRHYWTYDALGNGTPINRVQSGGNWKSPVMVLRYAKRRGITNEGVLITE